jgi:hypothetical protein
MSTQDVGDILEHLRTWPGSSSGSGASVSFFAMGGADRDLAPDATAFVHRDAVFIAAATSRWTAMDGPDAPSRAARWIDGVRRGLAVLGPGSFVNFPDPTLPRWWDAYYGSNYQPLVAVKSTYDPAGLFRHPQSIRPLPYLRSATAKPGLQIGQELSGIT